MAAPFYYHPRMMAYDFGPRHPLRPIRLQMTAELWTSLTGNEPLDPGLATEADLLRVHDLSLIEAVRACSEDGRTRNEFGLTAGDNPPFLGMWEASLAYCGGTVAAARDVVKGAPLSINISGGLHHAHRARSSGFCIFDDPAIALSILRERWERVAYVDIDLHHGDGVQFLFYDDPSVMTCSIHESGRTLYPGTGFTHETGAEGTSVNVPLAAGTTGDVWLWAFERGILPRLERFQPGAIVLQMGCDPHVTDPLGHLRLAAQEWRQAVCRIRDLGVPLVAVGGGGYDLRNVARMWTAACLELERQPVPNRLPEAFVERYEVPSRFDDELPAPRESGRAEAEAVIRELDAVIPV